MAQLTEQNTKLQAQSKHASQTNKELAATKQSVEELEKSKAELAAQLATVQESILYLPWHIMESLNVL